MTNDWPSYLIFAVIILLAIWVYSRGRRRKGVNSPKMQTIMGAISLVDDNLKIFEKHRTDNQSTKKFKTIEWVFYKDKLDIIDPDSLVSLNQAFALMEGFNEKIEIARKSKDTAILQGLPIESLKEPLYKGRQGLAQWLKANIMTETAGRRGPFGF
jgi:hypothetical protein